MSTPTPLVDGFSGVRLKIERARKQIDDLNTEIIAFLNLYPYMPWVHFDRKTQELTVNVKIEKAPPTMMGVSVGEIVHNLRSALDHIVWQLVILETGSPPVTNKTQFPIFEYEAGFDDRGRKACLFGVGQKAVNLIRSEQPFRTRQDTIKLPLWHLHELSNFDKHRMLHVTGTMVSSFQATFPPLMQDVRIDAIEKRQEGPIQQDAVLWRGRVHGAVDWPFVSREVHCHLSVDIAFDQRTPAVGGWIVTGTLKEAADRVTQIASLIATDIFSIKF